jgi:hypothetical protein
MRGIVLRQDNEATRREAKRHGLAVSVGEPSIAYERTLIIGAGVSVPWRLLDAAFGWLEKWDCAAPLWRYGVLAKDVGGPSERERTQAITRDLRIPLYATELLLIRRSDDAERLMETWRAECADGADERLAFLRALYQVKPLHLALPRSWLQDVAIVQESRRGVGTMTKLIQVEIAPGRYVCCRPEEAEDWKRRLQPSGHRGRRTSDAH